MKYNTSKTKNQALSSFLNFVNSFLSYKLSRVRVLGVQNENGDVKFFKLPVRGTELYYRFYIKRRFKEIKRALGGLVKVEGNKTNAIFLTLTYDKQISDLRFLDVIWSSSGLNASDFINRLKKRFKRLGFEFEYVKVIEAQRFFDDKFQVNGKPHFHFVLVFRNTFFRFHRRRGKYWFSDKVLYRKLLGIIEKTWGLGFVSISPVFSSGGAVSYISKYISKSSFLEFSGDFKNDDDFKKRILFYYLLMYHLRFFSVSRGLTKLDKTLYNNSDTLSGDRWVLYRGEIPVWVVRLFSQGVISLILRGFLNSS